MHIVKARAEPDSRERLVGFDFQTWTASPTDILKATQFRISRD